MNHVITSKEQLLEAAKEIAYQEGISSISIRHVAAKCGVSIGSIYNYFPTKADLVMGVIEDFWSTVVHNGVCRTVGHPGFVDFLGQLYQGLHECITTFQSDFLQQLDFLSPAERQKGKEREAVYMRHIQVGLRQVLEQDDRIQHGVWSQDFTKEELVSFAFSNMLMLLRANQPDCRFFQQALRRMLYTPPPCAPDSPDIPR